MDRYRTALIFGIYFILFTGLLFAAIDLQKGEQKWSLPRATEIKESYTKIAENPSVSQIPPTTPHSSASLETPIIETPQALEVPPALVTPEPAVMPAQESVSKLDISLPDSLPGTLALASTMRQIGESRFFRDLLPPLNIEVTHDRVEPRGRMTPWLLSMVAPLSSESEFIKVFTHEIGHSIDVEHFVAGTLRSDVSQDFYTISWLDTAIKRKGQTVHDFVSGYAMTNKYEDFAETLSMFVFHNREFSLRASKNKILEKKYNFMAEQVFVAPAFMGTSFEITAIDPYIWDTTKVAISPSNYLRYIR